jgi:hypothetical protein
MWFDNLTLGQFILIFLIVQIPALVILLYLVTKVDALTKFIHSQHDKPENKD